MIIGHAATVMTLQAHLPPVTILIGPASIGKRTLARHLADWHDIPTCDRMECTSALMSETARSVVEFARRAPFGHTRLSIIPMDGASTAAQNILLKTLEEPPDTATFILTATASVLPTVQSRAQVFHLGLLTDEQVVQILSARGMSPEAAHRAAVIGMGQVQPALDADTTETAGKTLASNLLGAVAEHDAQEFERLCTSAVTGEIRQLVKILLMEGITNRWRIFERGECHGLDQNPERLRAMLQTLHRHEAAAPSLSVRTALEQFL